MAAAHPDSDAQDVSNNGSIGDPDEGWAHAAVLVEYLNRRCQQQGAERR